MEMTQSTDIEYWRKYNNSMHYPDNTIDRYNNNVESDTKEIVAKLGECCCAF
jgi:hypothetical protein